MLARPNFAFNADEIGELLAMLRGNGELIQLEGSTPALPDADDSKFLRCARVAGAEYIVTGNKRHFPQNLCGTIRVVSTGELLDRITREI